ncbi:septal ring lytic transglycosylase RlpA family protein [Aureimonas leprariae]|uniref:septal ring lytic transglycosylase RlpA family protein n=1 Tax=Plantimonas leprariae TaxID=2615207 RepID=UPI001FE71A4F|nr:septal ring lytic transglycosylase RlpA family protein [Aureimonas leprariae]
MTFGLLAVVSLAGCQAEPAGHAKADRIKSDPNERFTEAKYGVKASPRVTDLRRVPKGGGRDQVGRPYKVAGKWYYPKEQPGYSKVGNASWYGASFHGRLTANGEVYDMFGLSAAHPTFPLPSYARVTNMDTGANVVVRVNDRGPYVSDRMMDLSSEAAELLGYKTNGTAKVKLDYIGRAPLEGDDTAMLMASFHPGNVAPSVNDGLPSGVMLAMNETAPRGDRVFGRAQPSSALPGVRPVPGAASGQTTIDSIIQGSQGVPTPATKPHRFDPSNLIVASYAPAVAKPTNGAAGAIGSMLGARETTQRIEIGVLGDPATLAAVRAVADKYGRLVADPDGKATSYVLETAASVDVDVVLREAWQAGAGDAFVLRD